MSARLPVLLALLAAAALLPGCALRYQGAPTDYSREEFPVVSLRGADIRYDVQGPEDGPAVVLVHGYGSTLHAWDLLVPALTDRYRVIRLDLKGFGRSSKYAGDYATTEHAEVVLALLDHLGVERAHVVAHSMGSAVALAMALQAPDRVDSMVLAGPWVYEEQVPWGLHSARTAGMGELIFGLWYAENLQWRFSMSFHEPERWVSEEVMERAQDELRLPGAKATALATIRDLELAELQGRYGEVDAPVLIVQGREDQVARQGYGECLAAQLPRAELELVPHCGHFPMLEVAASFDEWVRTWLDEGWGVGR